MSITRVERITCDNPDCVTYVDELIRTSPGHFELRQYVRSQAATRGWTSDGESDFCPVHGHATPSVAEGEKA